MDLRRARLLQATRPGAPAVMKLILAPHVDDEVLGCGGILDASCFVYVCGIDESHFRAVDDPTPVDARLVELEEAAAFLGFQYEVGGHKVNHYRVQDLITPFEDLVNRLRPDRVYLPHPGYNQDHRVVYDAAMTALRPHDRNHFVKKVLVYEAAHDLLWDPANLRVNHYVPIDVERKIQAYRRHTSQVRGMRSPDLLRHIAALRGAAINVPYAEAFQILRWVE